MPFELSNLNPKNWGVVNPLNWPGMAADALGIDASIPDVLKPWEWAPDILSGDDNPLDDPLGREAGADEMSEIYRDWMDKSERDRKRWLRGFEQFDPHRMPWGEYQADPALSKEENIRRARERQTMQESWRPPGSEEYDYFDMPEYTREGGEAPQYQSFQDTGPLQYDPYQMGEMTQYQDFQDTGPLTYDEFASDRPGVEYEQWTGEGLGEDPAYQFMKQQGIEAIEQRASQQGRSLAPSTDKDIADYVTGLASQEGDKAYGRHMGEFGAQRRVREWEDPWAYQTHMGDWGAQQGQRQFEVPFAQQAHMGDWAARTGQERWQEDFGRGTQWGDWDRMQGQRQFESPYAFQRGVTEHGLKRGDYEADRGFGLQEYATLTPMEYNMMAGDRQFRRGADVYDAATAYQQDLYPSQFAFDVQNVQNPQGHSGMMMSGTQGLAGAAQAGAGTLVGDLLTMAGGIGQGVAPFVPLMGGQQQPQANPWGGYGYGPGY